MVPRAGDADSAVVDRLRVAAHTVPTDSPDSEGGLAWASRPLAPVTAAAAGETGLGRTYAGPAARQVVAVREMYRVA